MSSSENQLIERLPRRDRAHLLALCDKVPLRPADVLFQPGRRMAYGYFPISGVISLVSQEHGDPGLEVSMVGREGMLGAALALGAVTTPLRALVQAPGMAWRIGCESMQTELVRSAALRRGLNDYLWVLMRQLSTAAVCMRFHLIGPRLARWLLMSQDRVCADQFHVTHQVLAGLLGVRRVGITAAANGMRRDGLIEYHRGELAVRDRAGLEAAACACYAADRKTYRDVIG